MVSDLAYQISTIDIAPSGSNSSAVPTELPNASQKLDITQYIATLSSKQRLQLLAPLIENVQKKQNLSEKEMQTRVDFALKHIAVTENFAEKLVPKFSVSSGPGMIELFPGSENKFSPILAFSLVSSDMRKNMKESAKFIRSSASDVSSRITDTLRNILQAAGITVDEFIKTLGKEN